MMAAWLLFTVWSIVIARFMKVYQSSMPLQLETSKKSLKSLAIQISGQFWNLVVQATCLAEHFCSRPE